MKIDGEHDASALGDGPTAQIYAVQPPVKKAETWIRSVNKKSVSVQGAQKVTIPTGNVTVVAGTGSGMGKSWIAVEFWAEEGKIYQVVGHRKWAVAGTTFRIEVIDSSTGTVAGFKKQYVSGNGGIAIPGANY